jgi:hypothetical protein
MAKNYIGISIPERYRPILEQLKEKSNGLRVTYSEIIQYLLTKEIESINKTLETK